MRRNSADGGLAIGPGSGQVPMQRPSRPGRVRYSDQMDGRTSPGRQLFASHRQQQRSPVGRRRPLDESQYNADGSLRLMSLSDLIQREEKLNATPLYEHEGGTADADAVADPHDTATQMMGAGAVSTQDALKAAEHGNPVLLAKWLQDGGDPGTLSRLHHMRWSLLHLAAGCATMGAFAGGPYRSRPEPDCNDGYSTCVSVLLAAGAEPNVASKQGGYSPLMGAALTGNYGCCYMLLRAGAKPETKADNGRTAFDFAQQSRSAVGAGPQNVLKLLRQPPRLLPRSPLQVTAECLQRSELDAEEEDINVQVHWRIPSQDSLLPTRCGEIERYIVKCFSNGRVLDVVQTSSSTSRKPRRDFCRNPVVDRGVALRKNLSLPPPSTASTVIHNLLPGLEYSFTVICVAEVNGVLSQSPPSCISKPVFVPHAKDEGQWSMGGVLNMVMAKEGGEVVPGHHGPQQGMSQQKGQMQMLDDLRHLSLNYPSTQADARQDVPTPAAPWADMGAGWNPPDPDSLPSSHTRPPQPQASPSVTHKPSGVIPLVPARSRVGSYNQPAVHDQWSAPPPQAKPQQPQQGCCIA